MVILGISAYYHDSAAAILVDGRIMAASVEERWSRKKHDKSFPRLAVEHCIREAKVRYEDIDYVVFYEKPFVKFERILTTHIQYAPRGWRAFCQTIPIWLKERLNMRCTISKEMGRVSRLKRKWEVRFIDHHVSHAALAYYTSGRDRAALLVVDAVGENSTTSIFKGINGKLELIKQQNFPNSLGLLYSSFTYFLGFQVNSDEYKVMGLAPYGNLHDSQTKKIIDIIKTQLISMDDDGSIVLNPTYFSFLYGRTMIDAKVWEKLLGIRKRKAHEAISTAHQNMAAAIQYVAEKILLKLAIHAKKVTGLDDLCLAGGCALNCSAMGKIRDCKSFESVYVPFAPGDDGCAIGAALQMYALSEGKSAEAASPYLGPGFSDDEILIELQKSGFPYKLMDEDALYFLVSQSLSKGKIVGWFQDRMEFGPRALGNRSIFADPRLAQMKDRVNAKVKFRESFRPFAPVVLQEEAEGIFGEKHSPYMMFTAKVKTAYDSLPAVTHLDGSARIQTVNYAENKKLYQLLKEFHKQTKCPALLNTSFNVMGEPIVCTPADAINTFSHAGIDILVIHNYMVTK